MGVGQPDARHRLSHVLAAYDALDGDTRLIVARAAVGQLRESAPAIEADRYVGR
jgi:hypothetical protein